ncbi:bifunctional glutamate N-acetyltransferase/amino-acid acetyltransferase ArgJ [Helicobacter sp. MIT 21-1697]|uniref:bifunctional glutamate N-acetyltransferase/amino-acid acetyltransferase ArgJ n=1 Tax=Helicobacter sp. MIT 21-1697 TaxID=2993733 RepID=UPI00224B9B0F|nr:bifunctional glutamate N-acetyltransferase/amino-acid acetyltransferase ArgJ [Helicobacter sp. MIT 21-1697]MCX2717188.1 bifunctional glutamate N-acetyltransferase/amino-acid acetyltransferase ArgJ [Helicobacter sp. MIT 21-1697]
MFEIIPIKGGVNAPEGFYADGVSAGLKPPLENGTPALDVAFLYSEDALKPFTLFTSNRFQAAPIIHFKRFVQGKESNFVLINTKNANAMTGEAGVQDVCDILSSLRQKFPFIQNPIMSSTGVIGQYLPKEKIIASFSSFDMNAKSENAHTRAADAIRTTDAFSKEIALKVQLNGGKSFCIGAMAKGAGMIQPALATMLCFITTDAALPEADGDRILRECAKTSFDAISVDGDMSTNDSVFLFANGRSGVYDEMAFKEALKMIMHKLATDMVRDGEGSTKLVAFEVCGARDEAQAMRAAKALTNSLLVKTAIFGQDPNWGRIASTIGASGVECNEKSLKIAFDSVVVFDKGQICFDEQSEAKAAAVMKQESFRITCDLGIGDGHFVAYGCDLGYRYVEINADYRS